MPPPIKIIFTIASAPQTNLEHLVVLQTAFLPRASERAAVGLFLAEHFIVGIRMGIHMDQRDRPVFFSDRPQDWPAERVIPAQCQRDRPMGQDLAVVIRDNGHGFLEVKKVDRHVTDICHLKMFERGRTGRHVVGADHAAFVAYLAGA